MENGLGRWRPCVGSLRPSGHGVCPRRWTACEKISAARSETLRLVGRRTDGAKVTNAGLANCLAAAAGAAAGARFNNNASGL